jgi:ribosomal RNA-processing protein 9
MASRALWAQGCRHRESIERHAVVSTFPDDPIPQALSLPSLNNPSHQFVSASAARSLCLHSISTLSLIDTFFGHQDSVNSVSSIKPTVAVTSGARDRTCRWWKLEEEVQLVFRAGVRSTLGGGKKVEAQDGAVVAPKANKGKGKEFVEGSVDVVAMLDDQHFVSGGDSG